MIDYYSDGCGESEDRKMDIDCAYCIICPEINLKILKTTEQKFSCNYMEVLALFECLKICEHDSNVFIDYLFLRDLLVYNARNPSYELTPMIDGCKKLTEIERRTEISVNPVSLTWIKNFKTTLAHYMECFVIDSICNSIDKFIKINEVKVEIKEEKETRKSIKKDSNFFYYLLFLEFYSACQIEGAVARQSILSGKTGFKNIEEIKTHHLNPKPDGLVFEEIPEKTEIVTSDPFEGEDLNV
jgi:sarcosine oxidase delta subunit